MIEKIKKMIHFNKKSFNSGSTTRHFINSRVKKSINNSSNYNYISEKAFMDNVVANRGISMIAKNVSSIDFTLSKKINKKYIFIEDHEILNILSYPNEHLSGKQFFENLTSHILISGNAYIIMNANDEINLLRPDRVSIDKDKSSNEAIFYKYSIDKKEYIIKNDFKNGFHNLLHIKNFNPMNDYFGISNLHSALDSVSQYNSCIKWNRSLIENGARPSGALVVNNKDNNNLSDDQFYRLKNELNDKFTNPHNAGKVMLLEGGLDWKDMSISPKDMDFNETKNSAARDIALSLGIPPQMLGIKGDNTYNNMAEARISFWEETILPIVENICNSFSIFFSNKFNTNYRVSYNKDRISALSGKRQTIWENVKGSDFLTNDEKRELLGFDKMKK